MGEVYDILQQKFKDFLRIQPQYEDEETMQLLAEGLDFELTDREMKLMQAYEAHIQERFKRFTQNFLWQEVQLPGQIERVTVEDVIKSKQIMEDWNKIKASIESHPSIKKQWDDFVLTLRLGAL